MNFLQSIKNSVFDYRMRVSPDKVVVDRRHLMELIEHFERIDSELRSRHNEGQVHFNQHLAEAITAAWHRSNKDGEGTLLVIMDTLRPLMLEERKVKERHKRKFYAPEKIIL